MTFHNVPTVDCDWPGCILSTRDYPYLGLNGPEIRKTLAEKFGWTQIRSMDFCDHHPLADHTPAVERFAPPGALPGWRATCSCGWNEEPQYPAFSAKNVWPSWRRHLPQEDPVACLDIVKDTQSKRYGWD